MSNFDENSMLNPRDVLSKLDRMKNMIKRMMLVHSLDKSRRAINLSKYVENWYAEVKEKMIELKSMKKQRRQSERSQANVSLWIRFFGGGNGNGKTCVSTTDEEETSSLFSMDSSDRRNESYTIQSTTPSSHYAWEERTPSSAPSSHYVCSCCHAEEEEENSKQPSLALMTCHSLKKSKRQPMIAPKCSTMTAYDVNENYDSYRFQTVHLTTVTDHNQETNDDTRYSSAMTENYRPSSVSAMATSSQHDALATQYEAQVSNFDDGIVLDADDLMVEIVEMAPLDDQQKSDHHESNAITTASVSEKEELESLRSNRSGLVRQMIDAFNRFKG